MASQFWVRIWDDRHAEPVLLGPFGSAAEADQAVRAVLLPEEPHVRLVEVVQA